MLWVVSLQCGYGCCVGDDEEEGAEDEDGEGAELDEVTNPQPHIFSCISLLLARLWAGYAVAAVAGLLSIHWSYLKNWAR